MSSNKNNKNLIKINKKEKGGGKSRELQPRTKHYFMYIYFFSLLYIYIKD